MLPHEDVYTRLGRSQFGGIGVIAIIPIPAGTNIFNEAPDDGETYIEVPKDEVENLPPHMKQLYDDFAVLDNGIYYCPKSFNEITPSYFLNHSKKPNVECRKPEYIFFSLRDIEPGEELLVDYDTYDDLNHNY